MTYDRWPRLKTGEIDECIIRVDPNVILETTLAQYALNVGLSKVEWTVEFFGPSVSTDVITINSGNYYINTSIIYI